MKQVFSFVIVLLFAAALMPTASAAAPIATVVEVDGTAQVTFGGTRATLVTGARVEEGSVIETSNNGLVQLTFDDGTNMVVAPRSRLEITSVLMSSGNRASRFAVNAVSGGFRFLSGGSNPGVYEINTPTATLGIRGTEFDIAVDNRNTALALFLGEVEMCARSRRCFAVRGDCAVAETVGTERVRGLTGRDAGELLADAFPLIGRQGSLRRDFRVNDRSCDRYRVVVQESEPRQAPPRQEPPPPPPPAPEEPTEFVRPGFDGGDSERSGGGFGGSGGGSGGSGGGSDDSGAGSEDDGQSFGRPGD